MEPLGTAKEGRGAQHGRGQRRDRELRTGRLLADPDLGLFEDPASFLLVLETLA